MNVVRLSTETLVKAHCAIRDAGYYSRSLLALSHLLYIAFPLPAAYCPMQVHMKPISVKSFLSNQVFWRRLQALSINPIKRFRLNIELLTLNAYVLTKPVKEI